ncbi:hypothetical protein Tco_0189425 [Tanacetum coccineum]
MSTLTFADTHNMVAFLEKPAKSDGFHEIIDFLNANQIRYALTIQALIDKKKVIITETSIQSDLHLEDAGGTDCLPTATIFEELARMGAKSTVWNEFSSTMASLIICLATNQRFNLSKYIFYVMVKHLDGGVKFLMYPRFRQVFINQQLGDMSHHKKKESPRKSVSVEYRAPRNQDNKKESPRKSVSVETFTSTALVSCDGLGGYDWSDQAEEGPNYALMGYSSSSSDSEVSSDSNCLKSCMETVKLLKSQNDQVLTDLEKSSLMVLGYKTGEITISELRKNLEKLQKEKDSIQFNVDKFKNASKSLNKLIECQIVDNYKKGLGYEKYNVVPPPYTGNFMLPTPDLSFTGLDEFVNKPVVKNRKSGEEVSEIVRKNDDAPIIEEWMSDSEEENMSQPKTEKKTVKPSIAKIEFVKPKQQEKTTRKTVKQAEKHRQNTYSLRGNQRN